MQIFKVSIIWEGGPNGRLPSRLQNQTRIYIVNYCSVANYASFLKKWVTFLSILVVKK